MKTAATEWSGGGGEKRVVGKEEESRGENGGRREWMGGRRECRGGRKLEVGGLTIILLQRCVEASKNMVQCRSMLKGRSRMN